jgi:hypothetical protein
MKNLINGLAFQLGWFICVLLQGWQAWLYVIGYITLHLIYIGQLKEYKFIISTTVIGVIIDSLLVWTGVFDFGTAYIFAPPWLIGLWLLFASTFYHALRWFRSKRTLAVLFGATGGTISYLAGYQFEAVMFPLPLEPTIIIIGLIWALLFPLLLMLSENMEKSDLKGLT